MYCLSLIAAVTINFFLDFNLWRDRPNWGHFSGLKNSFNEFNESGRWLSVTWYDIHRKRICFLLPRPPLPSFLTKAAFRIPNGRHLWILPLQNLFASHSIKTPSNKYTLIVCFFYWLKFSCVKWANTAVLATHMLNIISAQAWVHEIWSFISVSLLHCIDCSLYSGGSLHLEVDKVNISVLNMGRAWNLSFRFDLELVDSTPKQ